MQSVGQPWRQCESLPPRPQRVNERDRSPDIFRRSEVSPPSPPQIRLTRSPGSASDLADAGDGLHSVTPCRSLLPPSLLAASNASKHGSNLNESSALARLRSRRKSTVGALRLRSPPFRHSRSAVDNSSADVARARDTPAARMTNSPLSRRQWKPSAIRPRRATSPSTRSGKTATRQTSGTPL